MPSDPAPVHSADNLSLLEVLLSALNTISDAPDRTTDSKAPLLGSQLALTRPGAPGRGKNTN